MHSDKLITDKIILEISCIKYIKSINGKFTLNKAKDLKTILTILKSHSHFEVKFFSAEGEQGFNSFYEEAYLKYKEDIPKVSSGKLEIKTFTRYVIKNCEVMPVLDPLHGAKTGRSKILKNTVKLSEKSQLIDANVIADHLSMHNSVLEDKNQ